MVGSRLKRALGLEAKPGDKGIAQDIRQIKMIGQPI